MMSGIQLITPQGGRLPEDGTDQSVDGGETSSVRGSVVDRTASTLGDELNLFPSGGGKKRSTAIGFIESGGDDPRLQDLL